MKNPEPLFFKESLRWIKEHPNATTHDLPEQFIHHWTFNKNDGSPSQYLLGILTHGITARRVMANQLSPDGSIEISHRELMDSFSKWQVKIAMAELHQKTDLKLKPLGLFDFPENECAEAFLSGGGFNGSL